MRSLIEIGPIQNMIGNQIVSHNCIFNHFAIILLSLCTCTQRASINEPESACIYHPPALLVSSCCSVYYIVLQVQCITKGDKNLTFDGGSLQPLAPTLSVLF